jgi:hypothetical protein
MEGWRQKSAGQEAGLLVAIRDMQLLRNARTVLAEVFHLLFLLVLLRAGFR